MQRMNHAEQEILRRFHHELVTTIRAKELVTLLYSKRVIDDSLERKILSQEDNVPNVKTMSDLLHEVKLRCTWQDFLDCLDKAGFPFLRQEIEAYSVGRNVRQPKIHYSSFDFLAEKLKAKIHNSEARLIDCDIQRWTKRLLKTIQSDSPGSILEQRKQADCCFVLLDSLAVLERTHSPQKDLWNSPIYSQMESLISKTSNPLVSRIRHHARFGVALFLGDQDQKAQEYLDASVTDAKTFLISGRDVGNCIFALVNYRLKRFAESTTQEEKLKTLEFVEEGLRHFENEEDEIRNNWRGVYYDKKLSCLLGLKPSGRCNTIANISNKDLQIAKDVLCEMEKRLSELDNRRKIHFYIAKARLTEMESKFRIARGYLEEAFELCREGKYFSELQIVTEMLGENVPEVNEMDNLEAGNDGIANSTAMVIDCKEESLTSCPEEQCTEPTSLVADCVSEISQKLNIDGVNIVSSSKRKMSASEESQGRVFKRSVSDRSRDGHF